MKRDGWLALLALLAGGAWWWKRELDMQQLLDKLIDTLPARLAQWGVQLAHATHTTAPVGIDPLRWAFFGASVMDRESNGGNTLDPRGPRGTGDGGHGLGLMQLDDRAHPGLKEQPEKWQDADWNILQGFTELRALYLRLPSTMDELEKLQRTAAAYNRGPSALTANDPDFATTGGNYGADVVARLVRAEQEAFA